MLFARKMVAPIRLCRAKQGHLGRQCWQGGPLGMLLGPAWGHGGSECSWILEGDRAAPLCQGAAGSPGMGAAMEGAG